MTAATRTVVAGDPSVVITVSSATSSAQSVAHLAGGGYVVTWQVYDTNNLLEIYAQRYDESGDAQGSKFHVNTVDYSYQTSPVVTGLSDGGFVIAWGRVVGASGIWMQRYDADGVPQGTETGVNTWGNNYTENPSITAMADGGYFVAWQAQGEDGDSYGSYGQRYDAGGNKVGGEMHLTGRTGGNQDSPVVTELKGGDFIVAYADYNGNSELYDIYIQRFDDAGAKVGTDTLINLPAIYVHQYMPKITAMDDGGYLVVWTSQYQDGDGYGIYSRRYDADGHAITGEIRVNTTTYADQMAPSVTVLSDGGYVIAWQTEIRGEDMMMDPSSYNAYGQVYGADGRVVGGEIKFNSVPSTARNGGDTSPQVAALDDGKFVVTWNQANTGGDFTHNLVQAIYSVGPALTPVIAHGETVANSVTDGDQDAAGAAGLAGGGYVVTWTSGSDIHAQLYDSSGAATGAEFSLNGATASDQTPATVTGLSSGGYVVTWTGAGEDGGVFAQMFDAAGAAVGDQVQIASAGAQAPSVAALDTGGYVVAYQDLDDGLDIFLQLFDAGGAKVGDLLGVNSFTAGDQSNAHVAASGGGFVVTWQSTDHDGDGSGIYCQFYTSAGVPVSEEILINTVVAGDQVDAAATGLADGGYVVTWSTAVGTDGEDWNISAQRFDADGARIGSETTVNTTTAGIQGHSVVAGLADGGYVVAWQSADGSGGYDIHAQRYDLNGGSVGAETVVNTGTSGDQTVPAITALADGGYVVSWQGYDPVTGEQEIYQKAFTADASVTTLVTGAEAVVNTHRDGSQDHVSVAGLNGSGYVVTWTSSDATSSGIDVHSQLFNRAGHASGVESSVNTYATDDQTDPVVTGLLNGGYVVTWVSSGQNAYGQGIFSQTYNGLGQAVGAETLVSDATDGVRSAPAVTALGNGGYVVAYVITAADDDIAFQRFDADGAKTGSETIANTSLAGAQGQVSVAAVGHSGFVITWQSDEGDGTLIHSQLYDAAGAVGLETVVDLAGADQVTPAVAGLGDGGYIITWAGSDSDGVGIYAQRYTASGVAMGHETLINTTSAGAQTAPAVTGLSDGGYVVTWQSDDQDGDGWGIYAQRFDANGHVVGTESRVNAATTGDQDTPSIAATSDGGYVITWHGYNAVTGAQEIYQRTFLADTTVYLNGTDGADSLDGRGSDTHMTGGLGDDTYTVDSLSDVIVEAANGGTDIVKSSISYTLSDNVENLLLKGWYSIDGTGNGLDNTLTGNDGDNVLDGGAGADTLIGSWGDDTYVVDNLGDLVLEYDWGGNDTVRSSISYTLADFVENLVLAGSANLSGTGNWMDNTITGNDGNNRLDGGAGNDVMAGGAGNDTYVIDSQSDTVIEATDAGTDTIEASISLGLGNNVENLVLTGSGNIDGTGNEVANMLTGNDGNNLLDGGAGADSMAGGLGNDTYSVDDGGDVVIEGANAGSDAVRASVSFSLSNNVENLILTGSSAINGTGNDLVNTLTGNGNDNVLDGGAGADILIGGAGNDTYVVDNISDVTTESTGSGTDTVLSSVTWVLANNLENLTLTGSADINARGNSSDNVLIGNSGANVLNGLVGADTMSGGLGNDTYVVDNAGDVVAEGSDAGTDTVQSYVAYVLGDNVENLTLTGTASVDATGNDLANTVTGNAGNNVIDGGGGVDRMYGGAGDDTYMVSQAGDYVSEADGQGTDTVMAAFSYTLKAFVENMTLTGTGDLTATGNDLNNVLIGNSGNNTLTGLAGADTMSGGLGNDTYIVDNLGDTAIESDNAGTDTVQAAVSFSLGDFIENLTLTGTAAINGTGNDLANKLTGNSSDNILDGGAGADILIGGAGNDTYVVDSLSDVVTEAVGAGTDTVQSSLTLTLGLNLENLTLTGTGDINARGNAFDNVIIGNSGNNVLNGLVGADTMSGGLGNDTYVVDNTGDVVTEGDGAGTDTVQSYITYALGANLENLTLTGTASVDATGNDLANTITGNTGNNVIDGGGGVDRMYGGAGDDTYIVSQVGDYICESNVVGTDTVLASITYCLRANIENLTLTGTDAINGTGNTMDNIIIGNSAANVINGSTGNDTLTGGLGADTFTFALASGMDTITDFSASNGDTINLHAWKAQATAVISQSGDNTVIDLGGGNTVTLLNTVATDANMLSHIVW